jgi:hypothetical protein
MCFNPTLSQQVFTTYQTTFCEMPLPHTFPVLATARNTPKARVWRKRYETTGLPAMQYVLYR